MSDPAPPPVAPVPPPDAPGATPPTAADAPSPATDPACLDCGAPRLGDYCHGCGQHHRDDRLTLRSVWRDFAERFLKWERGLPATVRLAVVDPGRLAREYVSGRRRRYVNPVSLLILGSALAVLMIPLYASQERMMSQIEAGGGFGDPEAQFDMGVRMAGGDPTALSSEERAEAIAESTELQADVLPVYIETLGQLYSVFSVVLAFALAGFLKLFFSGRPRTYTFAETLVLGFFFAGAYTALSAVVASAIALAGGSVNVGFVGTVLLLIVGAAWAATGFYDRSWGTAALGALSGVLSFAVYLVSVLVVSLPIVVFKML